MAKKKADEKTDPPVETPEQPAFTGPMPGMVRIVNLSSSERDILLLDGTTVHLAPFRRGGAAHISRPFLRKILPRKTIDKQVGRKEIRIEEAS